MRSAWLRGWRECALRGLSPWAAGWGPLCQGLAHGSAPAQGGGILPDALLVWSACVPARAPAAGWPPARCLPGGPLCDLAAVARWWRERQLQICFAGYGSTTFLFNVMDELAPLFASAPRSSVLPRLSQRPRNRRWLPCTQPAAALCACAVPCLRGQYQMRVPGACRGAWA